MEMTNNLALSIVRHPLRRDLREDLAVPFAAGVSILELRKKHFPLDLPVLVYLNGSLVPEECWGAAYPKAGDFVLFSVALSGGSDGGKGIFRMVLMLAISVAAMWAAGPALLGLQGLQFGLFVGAVTLVGGLLVNALIPPSQAKPAQDTSLDSQSYSWSPQNTEQQGIPVAKWYGLHKIYGNVICSFIENQGTDQVMNALVSLCLGPVKSLFGFQINDQPWQNFREVQLQVRYGYMNQSAIDTFQNTRIEYPASVEILHDYPYIYQTTGTDFDILEVDISLPNGLWQTSGGSSLDSASVDIRIEVRQAGTSSWVCITSHPEENYNFQWYGYDDGNYPPCWSKGKYIDISGKSYWWNCQSGGNTYLDHKEGDDAGSGLRWHWMGGVPSEDNDYTWDWCNEIVVENFVQTAYDFTRITEAKAVPLHYTYRYAVQAGQKGRYEVRITRVSADSSSTTVGDKTYFGGVREVLADVFQYPRHVVVGIRARATDQLSGSLRFSCYAQTAIVQIWDGYTHAGTRPLHTTGSSTTVTTDSNAFDSLGLGDEIIANGEARRIVWKASANQVVVHRAVDWSIGYAFQWRHWVLDWSDNPAWVAYDIFTQPVIAGDGSSGSPFYIARFDSDIDPVRIDVARFKEWADYCNEQVPDGSGGTEKRVTFNGGFDFDCSMWEAALRVCQVGRATPVWNGVQLSLAMDKPSDPVNLYTVGNIEASRFKETFLPLEERATEIEIDYTNVRNDYQRDKLTVYRPDIPNGQYKASLDLFGITKPSEAWRAGMYRLNCNRYLIRTVEIDVDIEAVNGQIGDVVYIQHDVPRWGYGGRLVFATSGSVTLDKLVTIEQGFTYKLLLRLAEDVVYDLQVTDSPGDYTVLHVSPAFDTSGAFDPNHAYSSGNRVRFAGKIYQCINNTTVPSPDPTNTGLWTLTSCCPLPEKYDVYAFGQVNTVAKPFRITDISRSQDQKVTLTLIEYRPEIYEFEEVEPPVNDYSQGRLLQMAPRQVTLSQGLFKGPEGRISPTISIQFTRSTDAALSRVEVWYSEEAGSDRSKWAWKYGGSTAGSSFEITGLEYQTRYAVILIPVDTSGNKLYHGKAPLNEIVTQGPTRAADLHYAGISGRVNLHTSGSSTTVTTTNGAFAWVITGSRILANSQIRTVAQKIDNNTVRVDSEVDWDNAGQGYHFSYDTNLDSLAPSEGGSTNGATFGENLIWGSDVIDDIDTDQLHSNSATCVTAVRVSSPPVGSVNFSATLKEGTSTVIMAKSVAYGWHTNPYIGTVQIYRGSTLLDSVSIMYPGADQVGMLVNMAIDAPGPGTYVYTLRTADSLAWVEDVAFKVMELRR